LFLSRRIQPLPKEKWKGHELVFRYETAHFFDVEIRQDSSGFYTSFIKKWSNRLRVTELWIDERHCRQGIGRELMDLAKSKARELGCRALILETQSCNEKPLRSICRRG